MTNGFMVMFCHICFGDFPIGSIVVPFGDYLIESQL